MDERNLQIPIVIDTQINEKFFSTNFNQVFELHEIQEFRSQKNFNRFVCYACRQKVIIYASADEDSQHGHRYHFQHPRGIDCEWKYDQKTKAQIYKGIKEGRLHKAMKELISNTLAPLEDWQVIDTDHHFIFSEDRTERAKPDVHAQYNGEDVAFEIQLRSEKPETIARRQGFYQAKGWKLIWVSAENSDIVSERFSDECIEVKQVQKDIAFSNRGNWFIFNKELSQKSIEDQNLTLSVWIWKPRIKDRVIDYGWHEKLVSFGAITFSEGQSFVVDFHAEDQKLKSTLRKKGKKDALRLLDTEKPNSWDRYIRRAKEVWPTLEAAGEDANYLHTKFRENLNERIWILKGQIVRFFQSQQWRVFDNKDRWYEIATRVSILDFGISHTANLGVIEKILLVLGYRLSANLSPDRKCSGQLKLANPL